MNKDNLINILDNRPGKEIGKRLGQEIKEGSLLRVVSAYFTWRAYADLQGSLDSIDKMKFLFGDPDSVNEVDPGQTDIQAFSLEKNSLHPAETLKQKRMAKACSDWVKKKCAIRTIRRANFLHGKMYHIENPDGESSAIVGSSNFTRRGLGFSRESNIELNLAMADRSARDGLAQWFDELWRNKTLVKDARDDVLQALARLWKEQAPEFVYYKTLFHIFKDEIEDRAKKEALFADVHFYDTKIWQALYPFQKDGVKGAINRLLRHNGCIIADGVGLGKTFEALAIIKFCLLFKDKVLVLCPKRLMENWTQYTSWANQKGNPFDEDRFNYQVMAHTDLSRESGYSGGVSLEQFDWGKYNLVVIDESHNFRNESRGRRNERGEIVQSRYQKLLDEVIGSGVETKVLMLSATPVNNTLQDLRNQIYLMTEKRKGAFRESLGIADMSKLLHATQVRVNEWQKKKKEERSKEDLFEQLGGDFFRLLDGLSIARGRRHVEQYYAQFLKEIGGFPQREKPVNLRPPTDKKGEISYSELRGQITAFQLAVYSPSAYLKNPDKRLGKTRLPLPFTQREREHYLIGMMRTNLLKRLESSAHALQKTLERTIAKIAFTEEKIGAYLNSGKDSDIETAPEEDQESDEFIVGKRLTYRLDELDCTRWREDLARDRKILEGVLEQANKVTVERDAKLAHLQKLVMAKLSAPSRSRKAAENRKVLIFTSSTDTAKYLFKNMEETVRRAGVHIAQISGGGDNRTSLGKARFNEILNHFSPVSRKFLERGETPSEQIDILIATDCISEGQNLQDCDMVVNYDIHWNPVRLIQRFGRIDRLGSASDSVKMVNFWPTEDLEEYLNLKDRVEARMALADAAATGTDDLLEEAQAEIKFRDEQLKRLQKEVIDFGDSEDGFAISDITLDDFLAELLHYLEKNRDALEKAPDGLYAVVSRDHADRAVGDVFKGIASAGVIFCLRQKSQQQGDHARTHPYYLVYIGNDGGVRFGFVQVKKILTLFGHLARDEGKPIQHLCDAFNQETEYGKNMAHYDGLLGKALNDIIERMRRMDARRLGHDRGALIPKLSERAEGGEDFELVSWLVIR